jgi:hypothetical protein
MSSIDNKVIKSRTLGYAQCCSEESETFLSRTNPFGISCSIIRDIINNKFTNNEIKDIYKIVNNGLKYQIKKVIIYKHIYNMYIVNENKSTFLIDFIIKMKNKTQDTIEYYNNIKLIYKIFKLNKIEIKNLKKELFKLKPIEEQNEIKAKNNLRVKIKFSLMTNLEKRNYYKLKRERIIERIGYEKYNTIIRNRYNKWYNNLSNERKLEIKNNRNLRYRNMPIDAKQRLLTRHKMYYKLLSHEKKEEYKKNRINKIKIKY